MADDQVLQLLKEIRDLQRQHLESYREAIQNQQEAIRMQREWQQAASRRLRILAILGALFVLAIWGLPYLARR
jgi:type II secretory pathway component PulM